MRPANFNTLVELLFHAAVLQGCCRMPHADKVLPCLGPRHFKKHPGVVNFTANENKTGIHSWPVAKTVVELKQLKLDTEC